MMKNVYAMIGRDEKMLCYTPMSPVEMFAMGDEAKADAEEWLSRNPDISFIPVPDYELMEAYYWADGSLDMVARYLGEPCEAEECACESKPYSYFINGDMARTLDDEDLGVLRDLVALTGGEKVDLELPA